MTTYICLLYVRCLVIFFLLVTHRKQPSCLVQFNAQTKDLK